MKFWPLVVNQFSFVSEIIIFSVQSEYLKKYCKQKLYIIHGLKKLIHEICNKYSKTFRIVTNRYFYRNQIKMCFVYVYTKFQLIFKAVFELCLYLPLARSTFLQESACLILFTYNKKCNNKGNMFYNIN